MPYTIGIMNVGAPAAGMNAAVRSATRNLIYNGFSVVGIQNGFDGFVDDEVSLFYL